MASPPVVQVQGVRALRSALRKAGQSLDDLRTVNASAARVVETAARGQVPVRSGRLKGSLRSSGTKTAGIVRAGGARVPYAGVIHWGWPRRNIAARMYIVDPAHTTEPTWTNLYMAELNRVLNRLAQEADGNGP